jgi:S-DNA-T family DNA segregation ATPase FtsK/SpoIIIE
MSRKKNVRNDNLRADITAIVLILLGIIFSVIIYSKDLGWLGSFIKDNILGGLIGSIKSYIPILLIILGVYIIFRDFSRLKIKAFEIIVFVVAIAGITTLNNKAQIITTETKGIFDYITSFYNSGVNSVGGGVLGGIISAPISESFNDNVAYIVLIGIVAVATIFITGITISSIIIGLKERISSLIEMTRKDYREIQKQKRKSSEKFKNIVSQSEIIEAAEQLNFELEEEDDKEDSEEDKKVVSEETKKSIKELFNKKKLQEEEVVSKAEELKLDHNTIEEYEDYEFPPTDLLNIVKHVGKDFSNKELKDIAIKLQKTLASFGVDAKVTNVTRGPTVTRYELQPNVGVKVSKILNLADDIALNLAAKSIRIEAPIPGKSAVGIEVPNKTIEMVGLKEIIESDEFSSNASKVSFSLGRGIDGIPFVADIAKMPHLLIAGSTGSGKSVCINSMIMSLLYKANPSEVKLILIDPKVVELGVYNGIPHLLIPVVTDPKKAAGALNWAVQEMVNRYNLFASRGVRDIKGYNEVLRADGEEGVLPQIVIIIDELADLMMVAPDEVEDAICRLAQMARAAGMHLVIATQRPSVDVITGIIKANIPSRIAFTVSSQVDSRTILDMAGAEKLLGKGDMLFFPVGESKPIRVQGSYVSDKEIEAVVDHIKSNNEERYNEDIIEKIESKNDSKGVSEDDECDELLTDAIELAVNMGQASASMIQRRFKVGYARAGRIIDQMEARGIVSGYEGSKPRTTLISKEEWEESKENSN